MVLGSNPVAVTSNSDFVFTSNSDLEPASSKKFHDIQATIECGLTLNWVRDMTRIYTQMHHTDKYSEHKSILWSIWPSV